MVARADAGGLLSKRNRPRGLRRMGVRARPSTAPSRGRSSASAARTAPAVRDEAQLPLLPRGPDGGQGAVRGRAPRRPWPPASPSSAGLVVDRLAGLRDVMGEAHAKVGDAAPGARLRHADRDLRLGGCVQTALAREQVPAPEPLEEIDDAVVRKILTTDRGPPSAEHVARWKAARLAPRPRVRAHPRDSSRCARGSSSASTTCRCRRRL